MEDAFTALQMRMRMTVIIAITEKYFATNAQVSLSPRSFLSIWGVIVLKIFLICSGDRAFKIPRKRTNVHKELLFTQKRKDDVNGRLFY